MFLDDLFSSEKHIVQIVPVPDCMSAMVRSPREEEIWRDATKHGNIVYMALINEDGKHYMLPYLITPAGVGDLDEAHEVEFRPAMHCKKCGQKMWLADFNEAEDDINHIRYECPCGATNEITVDIAARPFI